MKLSQMLSLDFIIPYASGQKPSLLCTLMLSGDTRHIREAQQKMRVLYASSLDEVDISLSSLSFEPQLDRRANGTSRGAKDFIAKHP